ncbi:MAG: GreA/GreB family elongation factor [Candidatus Bipolaricaulota bacterium]|nr:GreA/GreB family elongation factor [Candidatus Bipolaricaulota bacterium]
MEKEVIFLTKDGHALMQEELDKAKKILYEEIPEKLKASKMNGGDLRENKEYIYLQSEQQYYEREVHRLTTVLDSAEVISEEHISKDQIGVGTKFILQDQEDKESGTFRLVSSAEVDLENGKISVDSPVGKSLIGKREGQKIKVNAPGGSFHFRVIAINK